MNNGSNNDIYFITMENLSEYLGNENKKLSDSDLEERVKLNFSLFKDNNNVEKKKLLLNNCLLTFDLFEGDISADLVFHVYYELIKLQSKKNSDYIKDLYDILSEKYNNFSVEDKNKYASSLLELSFIIANVFYEIEDYEFLEKIIDNSSEIYSSYEKNDDAHFYYARIITLYGNMAFEEEMYKEAFRIFLKAYFVIKLVSDSNSEKIEYLSRLSFSLGNILFQADVLDKAQEYFIETINLCKNNEFESKFTIMHMSYNYLSQVFVCLDEYDKAINTLRKYLDATKDLYDGDEYNYICGEFYFRIGLIYDRFKDDNELCIENMNIAKEYIDKIADKKEDSISLLERINETLSAN